jgi:hypothetical protein
MPAESMENTSQEIVNPSEPVVQTKELSNQKRYILIPLGILLLLLIVGGIAYYVSAQKAKSLELGERIEIPSQISQPIPSPTINSMPSKDGYDIYTNEQLPGISFDPYTLQYPNSWTKIVERESEMIDILSLSKDNHTIAIWQGPTDGNGCIYEGEMPKGPYADYRNIPYTEIESKIGPLRRVPVTSSNPNQITFRFCAISLNQTTYVSLSDVGIISYTVPTNYDSSLLEEMDQIISTLDKAPTQ